MDDRSRDEDQGPDGAELEGGRRVRSKPGTEAARRSAREQDRTHADTRRASTGPDPDEQTDFSGVEEKLEGPIEKREKEADREEGSG